MSVPELSWSDLSVTRLDVPPALLDLAETLGSGQAFRWRRAGGAWVGVVRGHAIQLWREGPAVCARAFPGPADFLADYFRLAFDLAGWAAAVEQPELRAALARYPGLRVLAQEPWEVLLAFSTATARPVARIAASLELLAAHFGRPIARIDGRTFFAFPPPERIAAAPVEALWADCRLYYRARQLQATARALLERGSAWLDRLAAGPYPAAHAELAALSGIGPKVADCVCLFALRFDQAVPVDTHVWALARELLGERVPTRSLTRRTYALVADLFRARYGPAAGWAQQYLFHQRRLARARGPATLDHPLEGW